MSVQPVAIIPFPVYPISNITPFTYRDGYTFLEMIEAFRSWVNDSIIPQINDNGSIILADYTKALTDLSTAFAASTAGVTAAGDANVARLQVLFNTFQVNLTDAMTAGRINDVMTLTYAAIQNTVNILIAAHGYATPANVELQIGAHGFTTPPNVETQINAHAFAVATNVYSKTESDNTFSRKPKLIHAVFIGSSNVTPGTWPEQLCANHGWACHNYAIGGGSFTGSGAGRMDTMIAAAIADNGYAKADVGYVFIADAGNDMRAIANVHADAQKVFASARAAYPAARVICLPALWGWTDDNRINQRLMSVVQRAQELREAALDNRVEFIEYSWTWHYDTPDWMLPSQVHYTAAGYLRVVQFVEKYLAGCGTDSPMGWAQIAPNAVIYAPTAYMTARREMNTIFVEGQFTPATGLAIDTVIGVMPVGMWPRNTVQVPIVQNDRSVHTLQITNLGQIRAFSTLNADIHDVNFTLAAF